MRRSCRALAREGAIQTFQGDGGRVINSPHLWMESFRIRTQRRRRVKLDRERRLLAVLGPVHEELGELGERATAHCVDRLRLV